MATKIKTNEEIQCVDYRYDEGIRGRTESYLCSTITTKASGFSGLPMVALRERESNGKMLRIRKLTPKECIRLQGFTDTDYQHLVEFGLSDSQIYHMAGDSISVPCIVGLMSVISGDKEKHMQTINDYVEKNIIEERKTYGDKTE